MSHVIRISDSLYNDLKVIAQPFVDKNPVDVIDKIVNFYKENYKETNIDYLSVLPPDNKVKKNYNDITDMNIENNNDLKFSTIYQAQIGEEKIRRPNWAKLYRQSLRVAYDILGSYELLENRSIAQIKKDLFEHEIKSFTYCPDIGIFIQVQNANNAWKSILHILKEVGVSINIVIEWKKKNRINYKKGKHRLSWYPNKNVKHKENE
jgi:hypothetical protein